MASHSSPSGGIAVFSGGTAANHLVDIFDQIVVKQKCALRYIIPISDNGGSSSELIRMFGGPSVGDLRSRLVRLIPNPHGDPERTALKSLFEYRLVSDPVKARAEWLDIVESRHFLWTFISTAKKELIRAVFNTLNMEIVKRARPSSIFDFAGGSVGNLFLTGARIFSGSLESAIYLLSMICCIPDSVSVLPAINSNFTHHIAASLVDGTQVVGQVAISHPSAPTSVPDSGVSAVVAGGLSHQHAEMDLHDRIEDANLPGSLPGLRGRYATFSKDENDDDLPAKIDTLWYINPYGHELRPLPNPKILDALRSSQTIIYSIGSLYTSIIPSIVLRGVGDAIAEDVVKGLESSAHGDAQSSRKQKILILNASVDRETGPRKDPMTAMDYVEAIVKAARGSQNQTGIQTDEMSNVAQRYVTHLVYIEVAGRFTSTIRTGMPFVDVKRLASCGIKAVGVAGKEVDDKIGQRTGLRYDQRALMGALQEIMAETP